MKNTNQQDRDDPHKIMKLAEEEWDQTDTQLAKYIQNHEETLDWKSQSNIVQWAIDCLLGPDIVR
jgi:hypothetical protein